MSSMTVAELAKSVVGCEEVLKGYFSDPGFNVPGHQVVRLQKALADVAASATPDPEASDLYLQSDGRDMTVWHDDKPLLTEHQAGPVLWAHLVATLPTQDEPQPEPLDPGVRVTDANGDVWARVSQVWLAEDMQPASWRELNDDCGPLTIITPAPEPTPDERPFKVGDRVRVADDATWDPMHMGKGKRSAVAGHTCAVKRVDDGLGETTVEPGIRVHTRFLSHADAPC